MRTAAIFTPLAGTTVNVTLVYQQGVYEIINDSPYTLQILAIGGGTYLEPGGKNIYSNAQGGNGLTLTPQTQIKKNADGSINFFDINTFIPPIVPVIQVIVNEYFPGEVLGSGYPMSLSRSQDFQPPNTTVESITISGVTSFFQNVSNPPSYLQNQNVYLAGFDFTGQKSSAATNHNVLIGNLACTATTANQLQWIIQSSAAVGPQLYERLPWPLINASGVQPMAFFVDGLTAANTYIITFYFFLQ
jgi:hypothetical protein